MVNSNNNDINEADKSQKIDSLREMILNAEKTIQNAKAMLLQLEGKKKLGRKRKIEDDEDGEVIQGTFDGQIMMGSNGKQYPVPANYASKSKLVEGDLLKLTITEDGSFVYKQIGPVERRHAIGIVSMDEKGNHFIISEGKPFKVLLASITYFKAEPGDEVAIVFPRDIDSNWAAIENVLQKSDGPTVIPKNLETEEQSSSTSSNLDSWKAEIKDDFGDVDKELEARIDQTQTKSSSPTNDLEDEWTSDLNELENEIKQQN